jgi:polar amino acid transport system permease protein
VVLTSETIASLLRSMPLLFDGLRNTISLTILSLILGSTLGIIFGMGRSYGKPPLSTFIYIYEKVFRGIPLLVILFLIYFGLTQLGLLLDAFTAAVLGLALRSAAYQAQIFRSAINSIPEGQMTAGLSLGMSRLTAIRNIILPQMLRLSLPGWSNEFTIVLKDTSIVIAIGVTELMRRARHIYAREPELIFPLLLVVALIYFIMVISANKGLHFLGEKYKMSGYEITVER